MIILFASVVFLKERHTTPTLDDFFMCEKNNELIALGNDDTYFLKLKF